MDDTFFSYLQKLEIMAFFSGFPIVYAIALVISGYLNNKTHLKRTIINLLPPTYAIVGILYLGLQLKKLYPDYSLNHLSLEFSNPYLTIWGVLSILFFFPVFRKKTAFCLLHSFVFFFLLLKNIYNHIIEINPDENVIRNTMKVYTDSIILNSSVLIILLTIVSMYKYFYNFRPTK